MRYPLLLLTLLVSNSALSAPPNVVIVYADDLGYNDLGCFGNKVTPTPNLDKLAADGCRFTNFYVAQAVCSASRTALLTGCYPNRVGILGALGPKASHGISDKEKTIADQLKTKGYATAIYGKWHLGHLPQFLPTRHGFDHYFGLPYSNDMGPGNQRVQHPALPLIEGETTIETNPDQRTLSTRYTEHAVKFIDKNKDKPFFLYVPHTMPHVPLHVSDKFAGKSKQGLYGDVLMEVDWSVGEIVAALRKHGLENNTLVIFASDNGPWLSYGNHGGSASALREGKGSSFEGGVRVPCIAKLPGTIEPGRVIHEPAMTIDWLPTICKLCGAELPLLPIDGKDIRPLLTDPKAKSPQEAYFFYWGQGLHAVRSGPWKLHFPHDYNSMAGQTPGADGKPAAYKPSKIELSLFHLEQDQGETQNVADKHPDVVERLTKLADKAREDLGDALTKTKGNGVRLAGKIE